MNKHSYLNIAKLKNKTKLNSRVKHIIYILRLVKAIKTLPPTYSLNSYRNFVYNQGPLGSCTANAFCAAYRIMHNIANKDPTFEPSRLYFYYYERLIEGNVNVDSGADVIDGEHFTQLYGICSESEWPYIPTNFAIEPPENCNVTASTHKITSYKVINIDANLITNIKTSIVNNQPVLIAISIYDSFESRTVAMTGIVPLPNKTTETCLGGHELCLIGYDDNKQLFTVLNSWSKNWGDDGLCYIPYAYLTDPELGHEFTVFKI